LESLEHVFSQKNEPSEYEQIQAKRHEEQSEEQRKMLEEMKMASMALAQSFALRGNINKTGLKAVNRVLPSASNLPRQNDHWNHLSMCFLKKMNQVSMNKFKPRDVKSRVKSRGRSWRK